MSKFKAEILGLIKDAKSEPEPGGFENSRIERRPDGSMTLTINFRKLHDDTTGTVRQVEKP